MRNVAFVALLIVSAACKRSSAPPPESSAPPAPLAMPKHSDEKRPVPDEIKKLDALVDADKRLEDRNTRMMVSPAPAGFIPEPLERKVRLKLVLEKTKIRVGEAVRYRLEMTNVGRAPINYIEYDSSVFRWGGLLHSMRTIKFLLTDSSGKTHRLEPALGGRHSPMKRMDAPFTAQQQAESTASTTFRVRIGPGETLRSLGDGDSPSEPFRTMVVRNEFKTPGRYRIHVELDDRPGPITESFIKLTSSFQSPETTRKQHAQRVADALGPISTETILLEIVR
ncbi:MAG: hypothetical protein HYX59_00050 [Elusimicrobia bacterium]|nr:hypothetical protein [Elusimicrobiota bacterium]